MHPLIYFMLGLCLGIYTGIVVEKRIPLSSLTKWIKDSLERGKKIKEEQMKLEEVKEAGRNVQ